jgi:hypothetical protein
MAGNVSVFVKDPAAVLDYGIDWADWLDGDTIASSAWTVDAGLTEDSDSRTATTTTVWLSGGTAGVEYKAVNQIVTAAGRTDERTLTIMVRER